MTKDETLRQLKRDSKWAERWEKARLSGRRRFMWLTGVVGWGIPWAILMLAWRWWDAGVKPAVSDILIMAIVATGGGLAFGAFTWWRAERRYQHWLASQAATIARTFA